MQFTLLFLLLSYPIISSYQKVEQGRCEPVRIQYCQSLSYNETMIPNLLGHQDQERASLELSMFVPLLKMKCHPALREFLCAVYSPPCTVISKPLLPCREMCLAVRRDCKSLQKAWKLPWPASLDCDQFPDNDGSCIQYTPPVSKPIQKYECPLPMISNLSTHRLPLVNGFLENCGLTCEAEGAHPFLLDQSSRYQLQQWIQYTVTTSTVTSALTLLMLLMDTQRFAYPVRPMVYMFLCQFVSGMVYLAGAFTSSNVSCGSNSFLVQGTLSLHCSLQATIFYFLTLSTAIWWLLLCVSLFLSTKCQWGAEAFDGLYSFFHCIAWGLPLAASGLLVFFDAVDGDVLTGTCSVGNLNHLNLLGFQVVPTGCCDLIGLLLLLISLCSSLGIHGSVKKQLPGQAKKWEWQIVKFALFGILYSALFLTNLALVLFQTPNLPVWVENWHSRMCTSPDRYKLGFRADKSFCPKLVESEPEFSLFLLKYCSQFAVGSLGLIWIFNSKTLQTFWRRATCSSQV